MSAVLVYGERVEVPEGWIVVVLDSMKKGDRYFTPDKQWAYVSQRDFGIDVEEATVVIRRDPSATEKP